MAGRDVAGPRRRWPVRPLSGVRHALRRFVAIHVVGPDPGEPPSRLDLLDGVGRRPQTEEPPAQP